MTDLPYTLPEEDPFNVTPLVRPPRRQRSSLFNKWIIDQQAYAATLEGIPDDGTDASGSAEPTDSQLSACPDLGQSLLRPIANVSALTLKSYDFVDDEDIPRDSDFTEAPSTPTHSRTSRFFSTPSSIRSLHLSFRSSSPKPPTPSSTRMSATMTSSSTRPSFFPLVSRPSTHERSHQTHNRSSSLGTFSPGQSPIPPATPTSPKWRPSVLEHFSSPSASHSSVPPSEIAYAPSRPSLSSTTTHTSTTVTDITTPLSKLSFSDSLRPRDIGKFYGMNQKDNHTIASKDDIVWESASTSATLPSKKVKKARSSRLPLSTTFRADSNVPQDKHKPPGPQVAFSSTNKGGSVPRVSFSSLGSRHQKKKKLIVSGIGANDARKFDGVKRWCESFGEVSQIVRMPNGDLHVHFRSGEVADTVCRLRAKVYISGVGSVDLSWYVGNRR